MPSTQTVRCLLAVLLTLVVFCSQIRTPFLHYIPLLLPLQSRACKWVKWCKVRVEIRDFILIKGHNKNLQNTCPKQINNILFWLLNGLCMLIEIYNKPSNLFLTPPLSYGISFILVRKQSTSFLLSWKW